MNSTSAGRRPNEDFRGEVVHAARLVGADGSEVEAAFAGTQEGRVGREQDFADGVREAVVQVARHGVPEGAQVFGVARREILRRADVLRRREAHEEVVVRRTEERAVAVNG